MADLGATSTSVSATKGLVESGPASGISGIFNDISTGITNKLHAVGDEFEKLLSVKNKGLVDTKFKLPLANPLHEFATYNYIISLGCLDTQSYNNPAESYMAGKYPPWICKSASGDPNNRIKLADGGKYDFFIDDLTVEGYASFTKRSGNTNNTNITFSVYEPYSMGLFVQALQTAAYKQGHAAINGAPFLLKIEFRGNKETGQMTIVPNTTKFISMRLNEISMKMDEHGSKWSIKAYASSGEALNDHCRTLKSDATISGKTVQEILQSGEKSLQKVVNARYKEAKDQGLVKVQDEILILFPENIASVAEKSDSGVKGNTEKKSSATTNTSANQNDEIYKQLGVKRVSTSSSSSGLVQEPTTCNGIGKASLDYNYARNGVAPFSKDDQVWDEVGKIIRQSAVIATPGHVDFKFSQQTDIINAINQVILKSNIAIQALDPTQITPTGMRPWFRIDTKIYLMTTDANLGTTGERPKLYVYRVVPYMCHAANLLPPNVPTPGLKQLKKEVVKEYNYVYTGKNVDILNFEFSMSQAFYNEMGADKFTKSGDVTTRAQTGITGGGTSKDANNSTPVTPKGDGKVNPNGAHVPTKFTNIFSSMDSVGGSRGDTEATKAAKLFHDAVINSKDMQQLSLQIIGDPYYIAGSGTGNYTDVQSTQSNITKDGSMNYQNGEIHVTVNFRTPTDINQTTGMYNLKNSTLCQEFSGVFKLINVVSEFRQGQFKQTLDATRIQGQDSTATPKPAAESVLTTAKEPVKNTGTTPQYTVEPTASFLNSGLTPQTEKVTSDQPAFSLTAPGVSYIGGQ